MTEQVGRFWIQTHSRAVVTVCGSLWGKTTVSDCHKAFIKILLFKIVYAINTALFSVILGRLCGIHSNRAGNLI